MTASGRRAHAGALEVSVTWGDRLLCHRRIAAGTGFSYGDADSDFAVACPGAERSVPLLTYLGDDVPHVVVPRGAICSIESEDGSTRTIDDAVADGSARRSTAWSPLEAWIVPIEAGTTVHVRLPATDAGEGDSDRSVAFVISAAAGQPSFRRGLHAGGGLGIAIVVSCVLHAAVLAISGRADPLDDDAREQRDAYAIQLLIHDADEAELERDEALGIEPLNCMGCGREVPLLGIQLLRYVPLHEEPFFRNEAMCVREEFVGIAEPSGPRFWFEPVPTPIGENAAWRRCDYQGPFLERWRDRLGEEIAARPRTGVVDPPVRVVVRGSSGLPPATAERVLRGATRRLRVCAGLAPPGPQLIQVRSTVDRRGEVTWVQDVGSRADAKAIGCALRVHAGLEFGTPGNSTASVFSAVSFGDVVKPIAP